MSHEPRPKIDIEQVRSRLTMAEVCARDGIVVKKSGGQLVAKCPWHEQKTGSFVIGGRGPDRAHCFSCDWGGDIFAYWMKRHDLTFHQAVEQLASFCGVVPRIEGVEWRAPKAKVVTRMTQLPPELREKPPLPRMRELRDEEIAQLAAVRGLSVKGVTVAARVYRRIGFCEWPMWQRRKDGRWVSPCEKHWLGCRLDREDCRQRERFPSWVATDDERRVAEFRRLDGKLYPVYDERDAAGNAVLKPEDEWIKSWSTAGKPWPLGAAEIGRRPYVLMVEGGPDMLAAYHFLWGFEMLDQVAVVCVLGAGTRICVEALPYFRGKRVRIMMDNDAIKERKWTTKGGVEKVQRTRPGFDAAARWTEQLTAAGAVVEAFNLAGLVMADGMPVKDLNDLARCPAAVIEDPEIREAFVDFDF
jgi:hypothetical protein